jgi:hypothetical protein
MVCESIFSFSILWCCSSDDHLEVNLTKFGNIENIKNTQNFKHSFLLQIIMWQILVIFKNREFVTLFFFKFFFKKWQKFTTKTKFTVVNPSIPWKINMANFGNSKWLVGMCPFITSKINMTNLWNLKSRLLWYMNLLPYIKQLTRQSLEFAT